MTENNQTQNNQADLNKAQQPEADVAKPGQADQTLNQGKAGQEEKTFQHGQAELEAKQAKPDIEDDADGQTGDVQPETSNA